MKLVVEGLASSNDYYNDPDDEDYENGDNGNVLLDRQQFVQRQKLISFRDDRQRRQTQQQIRIENDDDDDDDDDNDELIESSVALGDLNDGVTSDNSQRQILKSQKIYQSNNNNNIHNGKGESLTNNGLLNPQLSQSSSSTSLSQAQQHQRITTEQQQIIIHLQSGSYPF